MKNIQTTDGIVIPDQRATVRLDNNCPFGVVGTRYNVIQNIEAFSFFDSVVGEGQAIYHTAGALGNGERIWILAKLPKDLVVDGDDVIEKYLILTNSHDGRSPLQMYFSPVRVVCQNTLNMSLPDAKKGVSIRHTSNYRNKEDEARRVLGIAVKFYEDFGTIADRLIDFKMNTKAADLYFLSLLKVENSTEEDSTRMKNQKNALLNLFENGKGNRKPDVRHSAWAAYNAVTEYTDHYRTVEGLENDKSNRLRSIWFGSGADLKGRAFDRILEVASIKV